MARRQPFISRVRLTNYKSIAHCDVRLGALTILVGANGSGKSNFLDALAFLARAVETTPNEAIEERGGLEAIIRRVPTRADSFSIKIDGEVPWDEEERFWAHATYGFEVARSNDSRDSFRIRNETCLLEAPSLEPLGFEVREGVVLDSSREPSAPGDTIEPDRLFLQVAGVSRSYAPLARRLRLMPVYNFSHDTLRAPEPPSGAVVLGSGGDRVANVLEAMYKQYPAAKQRLDDYLRSIVPGVTGVDSWKSGPYLTLKLRTSAGDDGREYNFDPLGMSDGTIRAIGVLTALFQPAVVSGLVRLIGIEEPEVALHPGAAGVLFDALAEAADRVQVLATSQSPDLFDRDDLDLDIVRAVSMDNGLTTIGEIDEASQEIVKDRLYTLGELMRGNQVSPADQFPRQESS